MTACGTSDDPSGAGGGANAAAGADAGGAANAGAAGTSPSGGGPTASGGSAGSGSAGAPTGGSDSGVVRGAISIDVQPGNGCALSAQSQDYPAVSSGHPVSATTKGDGIANQQMDANGVPALVHCTWFKDVAPFMIDAGVGVSQAGTRRAASLQATLVSGGTSTGQMSFHSKELPNADGYSATCTFSVIQVDPATRSVWGSFTCDSLTDFSKPTGCTVGPSYFFFEHCAKP